MAPQIDAMFVSPDTMTKGGGQHIFSFFDLCLCLRVMTPNMRDRGTRGDKVKRITEILS